VFLGWPCTTAFRNDLENTKVGRADIFEILNVRLWW
jgi:hypothetical protein